MGEGEEPAVNTRSLDFNCRGAKPTIRSSDQKVFSAPLDARDKSFRTVYQTMALYCLERPCVSCRQGCLWVKTAKNRRLWRAVTRGPRQAASRSKILRPRQGSMPHGRGRTLNAQLAAPPTASRLCAQHYGAVVLQQPPQRGRCIAMRP